MIQVTEACKKQVMMVLNQEKRKIKNMKDKQNHQQMEKHMKNHSRQEENKKRNSLDDIHTKRKILYKWNC